MISTIATQQYNHKRYTRKKETRKSGKLVAMDLAFDPNEEEGDDYNER